MRYINKRTGAVVETCCEIYGDEWVRDDIESIKADAHTVTGDTQEEKSKPQRGRGARKK